MRQKAPETGRGRPRAALRRPAVRRSLALAIAALGAVPLAWTMAPVASAAPTADDLSIVQTPGQDTDGCIPFSQAGPTGAITADVEDTPTSVVMTIELTQRLCDPVELKASIYSMPVTGGSWPQTLSVNRAFTIQAPSTTVVTFTKGCDNVQYDIHRGISPEWIHPDFGIMHGPLLFAHTAVVHWGQSACNGTTTTAPTTTEQSTTTTEVDATTTTAAPTTSVLGATTIADTTTTTIPPVVQPPTEPPAVEGVVAERSPSGQQPSAVEGNQLAFTGVDHLWALVTLAGALLVAGATLTSLKGDDTAEA